MKRGFSWTYARRTTSDVARGALVGGVDGLADLELGRGGDVEAEVAVGVGVGAETLRLGGC